MCGFLYGSIMEAWDGSLYRCVGLARLCWLCEDVVKKSGGVWLTARVRYRTVRVWWLTTRLRWLAKGAVLAHHVGVFSSL